MNRLTREAKEAKVTKATSSPLTPEPKRRNKMNKLKLILCHVCGGSHFYMTTKEDDKIQCADCGEHIGYYTREKYELKIHIDNAVIPHLAEQLEDDIANLLATYNLHGRIEDDITGNTTVFPIVEELKRSA